MQQQVLSVKMIVDYLGIHQKKINEITIPPVIKNIHERFNEYFLGGANDTLLSAIMEILDKNFPKKNLEDLEKQILKETGNIHTYFDINIFIFNVFENNSFKIIFHFSDGSEVTLFKPVIFLMHKDGKYYPFINLMSGSGILVYSNEEMIQIIHDNYRIIKDKIPKNLFLKDMQEIARKHGVEITKKRSDDKTVLKTKSDLYKDIKVFLH